jgi:hypothetical protein
MHNNTTSHQQEENDLLDEKDLAVSYDEYRRISNLENIVIPLWGEFIRSHVELRNVLRWAGRRMLRFENEDPHALEKIRETLKRADNITKMLTNSTEVPDKMKNLLTSAVPAIERVRMAPQAAESNPAQKKAPLVRPRSLNVLKFPAS